MHTEILAVDPTQPEPAILDRAAAVLRGGGLVAFPTETVYGLGANACDETAVAGIFRAKGRPPTNPLIVHIPDAASAHPLVCGFPETARRLAERFWPGPLTLVLPKSERVPDLTTAGGFTVALRVPAHPVALGLLRACGLPLAAPSANPSALLSPTTAEHVRRGLEGKIDMILDAGPTPGGLESTVLDISVSPPRLLRPGLVTASQIEAVIGPVTRAEVATDPGPVRSPGLQERHYAPRTPLECTTESRRRVDVLMREGLRIGWITWREEAPLPDAVVEALPGDPAGYARNLYAALHRLDLMKLDCIVVELPPEGDAWLAVHDRLRRASHA